MPNTAAVAAAAFRDAGIDTLFGYPGGVSVELLEEARKAGLDFVLARSELTAGFMANTYGDITGRPGVCIVTQGPGAAAVLNPTVNAYLDRSPMIVLSGQVSAGSMCSHQWFDQKAVYGPVTKASMTLSALSAERQLEHAIRVATTERPGPVHIDVPSDELARDSGYAGLLSQPHRTHRATSVCTEELSARLKNAHNPMVVVGNSAARRHEICAPLTEFCMTWKLPTFTTVKAKGVLPESHPCWAGVLEMPGAGLTRRYLEAADLILFIGFDPVEMIGAWTPQAEVVAIDWSPMTDTDCPVFTQYIGDVSTFLSELGATSGAPDRDIAPIDEHRSRWMQAYTLDGTSSNGLLPSEIAKAVQSSVPPNSVAVTDVGSHKIILGGLWQAEHLGTFFQSHGHGSMGYAIGASIATQMLRPDDQVVSFVGDGGLAMAMGDLQTIADRHLPIITIVFNDSSLDRIYRKQELAGYPPVGTELSNPDFVQVAHACGIDAVRVETVDELTSAVKKASADRSAVLVDVLVDPAEYALGFNDK